MTTNNKPKSTNALMKYLREEKRIDISGSSAKQRLMNIGYYHGYKGYRYFNKSTNVLNYNSFDELLAVYNFDAQLKSLFYPHVMFLETALKNRVLDEIVTETHSEDFNVIYHHILDNYKAFSTAQKSHQNSQQKEKAEEKFKFQLKKRLELRDRVYKVQTNAYSSGNKIATHYLNDDLSIPIWGIFELLTLGEFGTFVSCMNTNSRKSISTQLQLNGGYDTNSLLLQRIVYAVKDLRNPIAHNDVVFDTRFNTADINKQVSEALKQDTGISDIDFHTITDYVILMVFILKRLYVSKREIKKFISDYISIVERLRGDTPINLFNKIIRTNNKNKVESLKRYAEK